LDPSLKHRYFIKATLSDDIPKSTTLSSQEYCLYELGPATSDWMSEPQGSTDIVGGTFQRTNGASPKDGIVVSSIVKSWIEGSTPNYGFVMRGKLETLSFAGAPSIYCVYQLDKHAKLSIVHS
jgi:hypothetical protein